MPRKILYFIAEDWFFCSHFLERAVAARAAGYEVVVLTPVQDKGQVITAAGLRLIPIRLDRRSLDPLAALRVVREVYRIYREEQPDIVHHIALKPMIFGTLAARWAKVPQIINALVGMGFVFAARRRLSLFLRPLMLALLKRTLAAPNSQVVLENRDDLEQLVAAGMVDRARVHLIRGAGVDVVRFVPQPVAARRPVVMLLARMLWDKGVGEFVAAANMLAQRGHTARFVLVGGGDGGNRACVPDAQLQRWHEVGVVEWWGFKEQIEQVLDAADIVCLPSYREGLPKSLLEGMAKGLPCVATDVPGCREVVRPEENGLLVPAQDAAALAMAVERLLLDPELRRRMGARGREMVLAEFSSERVIAETLALYRQLLAD